MISNIKSSIPFLFLNKFEASRLKSCKIKRKSLENGSCSFSSSEKCLLKYFGLCHGTILSIVRNHDSFSGSLVPMCSVRSIEQCKTDLQQRYRSIVNVNSIKTIDFEAKTIVRVEVVAAIPDDKVAVVPICCFS